MRVDQDYSFDADSPVGRYWLVHGVGFTVCRADGRQLGVVERLVVDPVLQRAERVIIRRRGVLRRPRTTLDASAVEAVAPASQRFLVASAPKVSPVGRAVRGAGAAALALTTALLRRVAAGLVAVRRLSGRGARAGARAGVAATGRARREAPRIAAWLSARAAGAWRATLPRVEAAARVAARMLAAVIVLAAVVTAAAWRRAAALANSPTMPPDEGAPSAQEPDAPGWPSDADAPLGREESGDGQTRPHTAARRSATSRNDAGKR